MRILLKLAASVAIFAIAASLLDLWYRTFLLGKLYASAGMFVNTIGVVWPFAVIGTAVFLIIKIIKFKPASV